VPEGHTIHRLARDLAADLAGAPVRATSPQGRFADGASAVDGRVVRRTDAYGKHLFREHDGDLVVHIHLGLYGTFRRFALPLPEPRGALRLRIEGERTGGTCGAPPSASSSTRPARRTPNAISIGHYPDYVNLGSRTGAPLGSGRPLGLRLRALPAPR